MAFRGHKTGWSAEGPLISASDANPNPQDAVHLQVDFGEAAAQYYTLQFSLVPPAFADTENTADIRGKAEIRWSVEGNFVRRVVSVWNGSSISGLGQGVSIKITDDTYNPDDAPTSFIYRVSVQVTKGTRPTLGGTQPPIYQPLLAGEIAPLTLDPDITWLVPAGSTLDVPIPEDAGVNCVYIGTQGSSGAALEPEAVQTIQFANGIGVMYGTLRNCNRFEPLLPGATQIRLGNNTAADLRVTIFWGVEG